MGFQIKINAEGLVEHYKAPLVAQGDYRLLCLVVRFRKAIALTVQHTLTVQHDLILHQMEQLFS